MIRRISSSVESPWTRPEFEQFWIDLPDSQRGVDVDREGDAERDQEYLFSLSDAKPDDHQRQRSQERDRADHLHTAVDHGFGDARKTDQGAEHEADGAANRKACSRAREADAEIGQQASVRRQLERSPDDLARCRKDVRRQPSSLRQRLPNDEEHDRRKPGEQLQAASAELEWCLPRRQGRIVVTLRTIECDR